MQNRILQGACLTLSALLLGMAAGGCQGGAGNNPANVDGPNATAAAVKPESRYKVTVETAPFFHNSLQQVAGPDEQLKKETRLVLLRRSMGYSEVQTAGGQKGYVDNADISQLSAKEIADEDAAQRAAQAPAILLGPTGSGAEIGNGGSYRPPPEAGRDVALPVPDAGAPVNPSAPFNPGAPVNPGASPTPVPNSMFR